MHYLLSVFELTQYATSNRSIAPRECEMSERYSGARGQYVALQLFVLGV